MKNDALKHYKVIKKSKKYLPNRPCVLVLKKYCTTSVEPKQQIKILNLNTSYHMQLGSPLLLKTSIQATQI